MPRNILQQTRELIREGKHAEEIACMMRLSRKIVDAEIDRFRTTEQRQTAS